MNDPSAIKDSEWPRTWLIGNGEHCVLILASNWLEARRLGAEHLETHWAEINRVERAPQFDQGIPTMRELVEIHGWYWECVNCGHAVWATGCKGKGCISDRPTWIGGEIYCSPACGHADQVECHRIAHIVEPRSQAWAARTTV